MYTSTCWCTTFQFTMMAGQLCSQKMINKMTLFLSGDTSLKMYFAHLYISLVIVTHTITYQNQVANIYHALYQIKLTVQQHALPDSNWDDWSLFCSLQISLCWVVYWVSQMILKLAINPWLVYIRIHTQCEVCTRQEINYPDLYLVSNVVVSHWRFCSVWSIY